jgi:hypothetical protein
MKNAIYIFSIILFFNACCKKGVTTYNTASELQWMLMPDITQPYFIFRDSITGVEDSVLAGKGGVRLFLVNGNLIGRNYNEKCEDLFEEYTVYMFHDSLKQGHFDFLIEIENNRLNYYVFSADRIQQKSYSLSYNPFTGVYYPTFLLNGTVYNNVYYNNDINNQLYFCSNKGIIKYTYKTDTSYVVKELVRSNNPK